MMQANDMVTDFVSEIYHQLRQAHLDSGKCAGRARLVGDADLL